MPRFSAHVAKPRATASTGTAGALSGTLVRYVTTLPAAVAGDHRATCSSLATTSGSTLAEADVARLLGGE